MVCPSWGFHCFLEYWQGLVVAPCSLRALNMQPSLSPPSMPQLPHSQGWLDPSAVFTSHLSEDVSERGTWMPVMLLFRPVRRDRESWQLLLLNSDSSKERKTHGKDTQAIVWHNGNQCSGRRRRTGPTCDVEHRHVPALGPQAVVGLVSMAPTMPCGHRAVEGSSTSRRRQGVPQGNIFLIKPVQNGGRCSLVLTAKLHHVPSQGLGPGSTEGEDRTWHWNW